MKITGKALGVASALLLIGTGNSFAQEFDDFGGGDDSFSEFSETTEPSLTWGGEAGAKGRVWIQGENGNESGYTSFYDICHSPTEANAYLKLDINYAGSNTDLNGRLKFDTATIKDNPEDIIDELSARGYFGNWQIEAGKIKTVWGKGDKLHVLDNFNANDYTDFVFPDYIDRRIGEPMLKISHASPFSTDSLSDLKFEAIWTPMMTADRFASDGLLVPNSMKTLTETVTGIVMHNTALAYNNQDLETVVSNLQFSSDDLYEDDIKTLRYGQAGARFTGTFSGIDFGVSYYYGHYKQPSANLGAYVDSVKAGITNATTKYVTEGLTEYSENGSSDFWTAHGAAITQIVTERYGTEITQKVMTNYGAAIQNGTITQEQATMLVAKDYIPDIAKEYAAAHAQEWYEDGTITVTDTYALPSLNYDQLQVFGLEAAFVLWKFNTRWEFAYNLTEDTAGDNPWVKNNSIAWVAGFDMDLPIHNFNINIQEQGKYILNNDKIEDGVYAEYDVDHNSDGKYTSNQLVVNISDKWLNEKLTTECTTIYVFETKEWCVQPKIAYNVIDGLTFTLSGAYIYSDNENGQFYNFTAWDTVNHNAGFVQLAAKYQF
ncbi:MAG: hypothetical protein IKN34_07270 [Treponema sp.]|nr:hypothetical protein [Treponema sp.]